MKNKINEFFRIFSGRNKDIGFTESIKVIPFALGWIISIGLMYYACKTNIVVIGIFSLMFSWQTGWGMSVERCCKSEEINNKANVQKSDILNGFYDAWWFLHDHKMFQNESGYSQFLDCLDVHVAKVNPKTNEIDDNDKLNTKIQIWLETGKYDKMGNFHDIDLDCGGDTYEEAIIKLANNVLTQYGNDKNRIIPSSYL